MPDDLDTNVTPLSRERDRPLRLKRRVAIMLAGVLVAALFWVASAFPRAVETLYTNFLGQIVARALGAISAVAPFSVAEAMIAFLAGGCVTSVLCAAYDVARRRRGRWNALACGALRAGAAICILAAFFYAAWGFNYARAGLIERMNWQTFASEAPTEELARVCEELVTLANIRYERANGTRDLGRPSAPNLDASALDAAIDHAYERVSVRLGLHPSFTHAHGPAKPIILSPIMSSLLILGFYSPWTGEANFNREMPPCRLPEVIAHEKAHQRGVTSEDEANFFGFLACIYADEPYLQYSGYLMAQRQLLAELLLRDRSRGDALIKRRDPGVQRDADAINAFSKKHTGRISKAGHAVNNAYLKANRVKEGVKAYQLSAKLILTFAHVNGGSLAVTQ